jgi:lipopolysaccharide export system protein LptC
MTWRTPVTLLLLLAALLSGWSAWRQRAGDAPTSAASHRPDYVLQDFELVSLDNDGKEAFTLRAPSLERDPRDETMALESPVFLLPEGDGLYWDLRAKTGWVSGDSEEMRLRGEVVAVTDPAGARDMRLETEELDVFPGTRLARSDVAVTVSQPGTTMRGTGMEADLAGKRFQLTSKVQTRYVPTRR